jgi:hypothetical protein
MIFFGLNAFGCGRITMALDRLPAITLKWTDWPPFIPQSLQHTSLERFPRRTMMLAADFSNIGFNHFPEQVDRAAETPFSARDLQWTTSVMA